MPRYVEQEFEAYLKCGRLEEGFDDGCCHSDSTLRPPIATERLALTEAGYLRYALKTPYRDGTTHVLFEPMDFIARLVALVPRPRAHLTRLC